MYAMGALTLAVVSVPLVFIAWRVLSIPWRRWIPLVALLAVILGIQAIGALVGEDGMMTLIYLLAGGGG